MSLVLPFGMGSRCASCWIVHPFAMMLGIVYLGLLVHSRLLPVAWAVMPSQEKWEEKQWSIVARLLDQIIPHLEGVDCTLIADRGKAGVPISEDLP